MVEIIRQMDDIGILTKTLSGRSELLKLTKKGQLVKQKILEFRKLVKTLKNTA